MESKTLNKQAILNSDRNCHFIDGNGEVHFLSNYDIDGYQLKDQETYIAVECVNEEFEVWGTFVLHMQALPKDF